MLVFVLLAGKQAPAIEEETLESPVIDTVEEIPISPAPPTFKQQVYAMPLEEKIGQLVLTGFEGTTVSETLRQAIEDVHIGHVILFKKNIESAAQLQQLNTDLLNLQTTTPLWISLDEEGGNVSRMPNEFVKLPTAAKLARNYSVETVEKIGAQLGELLHENGFTTDFAPVFDVNSNRNNPVIGSRAFSSDIAEVKQYAMAFTNGLQQQNILAVAKHFPGHGDTNMDSHVALPIIHKSREQLQQTELVPFQYAIDEGMQMIMVGHLLVPAIDPEQAASQSSAVMKDLLREDMGFEGVVITDDLTMDALPDDVVSSAVHAIIAGADIALIGHGTDQAIAAVHALKQAVTTGLLSEEQINESAYRILLLKQQYIGKVNPEFNRTDWNEQMKRLINTN